MDEEWRTKSAIHFSLTHDHGIVIGAEVARFLDTFVGFLNDLSWLNPKLYENPF